MTRVNAGVCGFKTTVTATVREGKKAAVIMETECPSLKPMADELKEVDVFKECFARIGESPIFKLAQKYCKHASCPVPTAILKEIEVAARLALPRDVLIEVGRRDEEV